MPIKPTAAERAAYDAMQKDPDFGRHVIEAIINETPELSKALLEAGLVEEIKE